MFEQKDEISLLKQQVEALTSRINSLARHTVDEFSDDLEKKIEDKWHHWRGRKEDMRKKSHELYRDTEHYIEQYPFKSLAIAAGSALFIGWLIGCLSHPHERK